MKGNVTVTEISAKIDPLPIIIEFCQKADEILERTSPVDTGVYKSGWTYTIDAEKKKGIVWNEKRPHITHFLEYGHRAGDTWVSARPHVEPAFEELERQFTDAMKKVKVNITERNR